jgi:hypothetical protein
VIDLSLFSQAPHYDNFVVPMGYKVVHQLGLINLSPWYFLSNEESVLKYKSISFGYGHYDYIPFASRRDTDDIVCFDLTSNNTIVLIHDFASLGSELVHKYHDFWEWLQDAVNDLINTYKHV